MKITDVDTVRVGDITALGDALANAQNIIGESTKLSAENRERLVDYFCKAENAVYLAVLRLGDTDLGNEEEL